MKHAKVAKLSLSTVVVVLLLLTSASFYFVSGTLAKYVTTSTATETARVAKWGVIITGTGANDTYLFSKDYYDGNSEYNLPEGTALVARSANDTNIVAPATGHSYIVTVTGAAEVRAKLTFNAVSSQLIGDWTDADGNTYEPIVWTVKQSSNGGEDITLLEKGSMQDFINMMSMTTKEFAPNEEINERFTISWAWDVATPNDDDYNEKNIKDTDLSQKDPLPSIQFTLTTTVTQVISQE